MKFPKSWKYYLFWDFPLINCNQNNIYDAFFLDLAEDEFSDEEGMDLLAPNHRRRSSKGEKRKLITATGEDIVIGTKPEKEPLHFDKTLFDEGKLFFLFRS